MQSFVNVEPLSQIFVTSLIEISLPLSGMMLQSTAQTASSPRISTIGPRILMRLPMHSARKYSVSVANSRGLETRISCDPLCEPLPRLGITVRRMLTDTRADAEGTAADWSADTDRPRLYTSPTNTALRTRFCACYLRLIRSERTPTNKVDRDRYYLIIILLSQKIAM